MRIVRLTISGILILSSLLPGTVVFGDQGEPRPPRDPHKADLEEESSHADIVRDFGNYALYEKGLEAETDRHIDFARNQYGRIDYYAVLVLADTRKNPLVLGPCYREAWDRNVSRVGQEKLSDHLKSEVEKAEENNLTYSQYLEHLHNCQVCGPLVANILACHIEAVARNRRDLILFDYASRHVRDADEKKLRALAHELLQRPDLRATLVGRASRTGKPYHNKILSLKRTRAVADLLAKAGVPRNRICKLDVGWEDQHINEWLARRYGYESLFEVVGKLQMNQSVIVVLSPEEEGEEHPCFNR